MVAGTWYNQDGLYLQYGTQKPVPEVGGDYLVYGETREIEQYIPLVPTTWSTASAFTVLAPPTSLTFVGTGTAAAAGIQSVNTFFPLQITTPQTASGSALTLSATQLFMERVELVTLQTIAPTTNTMTVGLVTTSQLPGSPNATFTQVTPNAGFQILGTSAATGVTLGATIAPVGTYVLFNIPGATGTVFGGGVPTATTGNGGAWLGNVPLVTNAITPLPQSAWISILTNGAFTGGLLKIRIKYNLYGNISY
jgi:hypothetical protein